MRQGEVRWYRFSAPDKRRPVLILTRNSAIGFLNALTIAPITRTIRDIPSEVMLTPADGLLAECAVNLDNIQTIPKANLGPVITLLSPGKMAEVRRAICFALALDDQI
jgi:mRNA interferase MazF